MVDAPIYFETKDILGIALLALALPLATAALVASQWLRGVALFVMFVGAILAQRLDINIFSAYWYRGTTRGFEVTLVDILAMALLISAIIAIIAPKQHRPRWFWPASLAPLGLFALWTGISIGISEPRIFGFYEFSKIVRGIVVFLAVACAVRGRRELEIIVVALACAVALECLWALQQRLLHTVYRTPGTLGHANSLSMYLCIVTPVLVAAATSSFSWWIRWVCWGAVGIATGGIFLTISRAGIPIFLMVVGGTAFWCTSWRPTIGKLAVISAGALMVSILLWQTWDVLAERYLQATLEEEYFDETTEGRGYYFRAAGAILDDRPFGVGLNNWSYWVSKEYGAEIGPSYFDYDALDHQPHEEDLPMYRFAAPAHNLGVLTVGELGWTGLAIFALLWVRWLWIGAGFLWRGNLDPLHKIGFGIFISCFAMFVHSFTEWTFRQTEIFLTFHMLLGALAALHRVRRSPREPQPVSPIYRDQPHAAAAQAEAPHAIQYT